MDINHQSLKAFLAVVQAGGFRMAARKEGTSPSRLSEAIRQLESELGVRLLNRSTRSVVATEAGRLLMERLQPAFREVDAALDDVASFRDRPAGRLKINVPTSAARLILPTVIPAFLEEYPDIQIEVVVDENFVDVLAEGCDAGIRYEERLQQDMIAIPIGPREQYFAAAASPGYLKKHGRPKHPRELLQHNCIRGQFASGAMMTWEFERRGETVTLEPKGQLLVRIGAGTDLAVDAAIAGAGVVFLFKEWLQPHFDSSALQPILQSWWPRFTGPFLYYPGRRLLPPPLRAFVSFLRANAPRSQARNRQR
jgi:DNA-binding transcriptional LysR family regulator